MADGSLPPLPPGATLRRPLPPLPPGATLRAPQELPPLPPGATLRAPAPAPAPAPVAMPAGEVNLGPGVSFAPQSAPPGFDPSIATGPTTEMNSPAPPENTGGGVGELLTNVGTGVASGLVTGFRQRLLALAEFDEGGGTERFEAWRPDVERYFTMTPEEKITFRNRVAKDHSPSGVMIQSLLSDIEDGAIRNIDELNAAVPPPGSGPPMMERPLFKAWQDVGAWQERNFGATPDYEGSITRGLSEGGGTVVESALMQLLSPLLGAGANVLSGRGEALERIYDPARVERLRAFQRGDQEVQPGMSAPGNWDRLASAADTLAGMSAPMPIDPAMQRVVDKILAANASGATPYGTIAGATNLIPLETLISGIPGLRNAGAFIKILGQAGIEGVQEMVEQVVQNWGSGTYDPTAREDEGVLPAGGMGAGVGAITEAGKEGLGWIARLLAPGRTRGGGAGGTLTPEQQAALDARLQPSTGGRMDVEQPELPMELPVQLPPGGIQPELPMELPEQQAPVPGEEQFELPLTQPGTSPTVQPVPGPGPPEGVPVTNQDIMTAHAMWKAAQDAYPPGDPRVTTALNDFMALAARYSTEREAQRAANAPAGTQVLPTNAQPPAPPGPPGEAAVPAPEGSLPATPPVAEPPVAPPALPGPTGEEAAPAPAREEPTAPLPPAPPVAGPAQLRSELARLQEQWNSMTAAERETERGKNIGREIADLQDDIDNLEPALARTEPEPKPKPTKPVTTKDVLGPVPPPQPDLKSFVIGQGGVQPTPNLRAQDATQDVGLLDNRGMTMDNMRQAMTDAGYIDEGTDANDAEQMIIDALQKDAPKIYPKRALDQADAAAVDARKVKQSQLDEMAGPVDDAIVATGRTDITEKERDQMIARAFSTGEPDEAVSDILRLRPEPAATVATDDEEIPFPDIGELPAAPGADGQPQLFMPGTERVETAGARITTGPELRAALKATGSAQDQFNHRYTLRPKLGGGHALLIDGKEAALGATPKGLIDTAVLKHAARLKRVAPPAKKQRGVTDLSLFSDEGKQTSMPVGTETKREAPPDEVTPKKPAPPTAPETEPEPAADESADYGMDRFMRGDQMLEKRLAAFLKLAENDPELMDLYNRVSEALKDNVRTINDMGFTYARAGTQPYTPWGKKAGALKDLNSGMSGSMARLMMEVIRSQNNRKGARPQDIAGLKAEIETDIETVPWLNGRLAADPEVGRIVRPELYAPAPAAKPVASDEAPPVQAMSSQEFARQIQDVGQVTVGGRTYSVEGSRPATAIVTENGEEIYRETAEDRGGAIGLLTKFGGFAHKFKPGRGGGDPNILRNIENLDAGEDERLTEQATGPAEESETGLWGDDPEADQQQEADDAAELELNTLTERTPRAGVTPTFGDVSMSTTTPGNADAAYTDAGLDPDQAKNMTAEGRFQALAALFKSKFGFKSVSRVGTYGQAKGQDAVDMMLDGYRAIRAMMHVLGMPETSGSLGGTLSLTIGRITKRSFMLGAYNPGDRSIELVGRSNGFAHEWAHALDHWLMDNVFGPIAGNAEKMASRFARNTGLDPGIAIEDHFIRLMNNLFFDDAALAARVLDLQTKAGAVHGPKHAKAGQPTNDALAAQKLLDDVKAGRSKLIKEKSTYYKTARQYGKGNPYWTNPAEMLARAFEAYVAFKIVILDPDFANNFMTKGEAAYSNDADDRLAKTFPKSADRIRIYGSFDTLMGIVNTQTALGGTVSAMPTANELLDDDMLYVHAARDARNAREKARQRGIVSWWKNKLLQATSLSGWNEIGDAIHDNLGARFGAPKDLMSWGQRGSMFFKAWFFTEAAVANTVIERPQNAKAKVFLRALGSQLFELAPGRGDLARETWGEAVSAYVRTYAAKLENILDAHGITLQVPLDPRSPAARDAVGQRNRLESILTTGVEMPGTSASERRAAAQIRTQIFDEIWRDAGRAGLDIGYVEDAPYLPIIPEPHAIHANREGFIAAATTLYELVFDRAAGVMVGNRRHVDSDVLQNAIQDIKNWNTPWTLSADPDIVRLRAKADRQRAQLKDLRRKQAMALRPDLLQAQIDALADDLQITLDELAIEIKPLWAATKAEQWHEAFIHGEYSSMDTLGPQTRHTKERVLPSESQQIMAEFIVTDPVDAAMIYINAMARKIEYSSRFGKIGGRKDFENLITRPKSPILAEMKARGLDPAKAEDRVTAIMTLTDPMLDDRLKMLMTEAQRAGALSEDLTTLREQVEFMTGRKSESTAIMRGLSNLVYAGGSVALMPRAWWTSVMEAVTVLARTGDIKVTGKVLGHQLNEAAGWALPQRMKEFLDYKGTNVQDINDLARTIGVIASEGQDVMLQVTLGDIPMSSRLSKFMAEFYERIGLAALTRMQKRAVLAGYNMWLNKLLRMAKGEPNAAAGDKAVARANLADLGIAEAEIKPLDDWLHARGKDRQMNSADAKTPMGRFWAEGARRFTHSVVQEGTKATSPRIMAHPMGRLVFGLMRFAYTFVRNILERPIRQALRDEKLRLDAGEGRQAAAARAFRDNLLYRGILGMGALWLGQSLIALLREWLFNGEQFERHMEEGDLPSWIMKIGASRSGVYGPFDAVLQATTGLRYQRDISSMTSGPFMNLILSSAQALGEAYYNNSPNTNTSERNLTMAGLRTLQTPIIMAGLTLLPSGRYLNAMWAGLGMLASSNSLLSRETSLFAGPRRDTGPKGSGRLDFSSRPKF